MGVPSSAVYAKYTANGATTVFAYPFKAQSSDQIDVLLNDVVQVSGFTISGLGVDAGGNITFSTAPANGVIVYIRRSSDMDRDTTYTESNFLVSTVNSDQDYQTMLVQEVNDKADRSMHVPQGSGITTDMPTPQANYLLAWNSGANALVNVQAQAGQLSNVDYKFSSVAAMSAQTGMTNGALAQTFGYYTSNDGGHGQYRYDSTSVATVNGGTVINAAGGAGRWLLIYSFINVKQFGAKGDGSTNDTSALQAALTAAANDGSSGPTTSGALTTSYSGSFSCVFFPKGTYVIQTSALTIGAYMHIYGDDAIIKQLTTTQDIFYGEIYQNRIEGIQFVGGRYHLNVFNDNTNSTKLHALNCQFFLSRDYAVKTSATGGVYSHLSASVTFEQCRFISCNKVMDNVCDQATLKSCWVQPDKNNLTASVAIFKNKGTTVGDSTALTHLHLVDCFLIPDVGIEGVDRINNVRWIDNYGIVSCVRSRFGGENGGMSICHHYGAPLTSDPLVSTGISFEGCELFAGPDARSDSCVIGIQGEIPQRVNITNCIGPVGKPMIANLSSTNIVTYMTNFESATLKSAIEYFKINIKNVISGINDYTPIRTTIPYDLYKYVVTGKQTKVRRAAVQSITNGFANNIVSFDTINYNNLTGAFSLTNPTRLVMPLGCTKARITAYVRMATDGAAKTMSVTIADSGLARITGNTSYRGINPDDERFSLTADVEGAPGTYWHVCVQHNAAAALNLLDCVTTITPIDFIG